MNNFADYAEYYNLFYRDKDYKGEADFVRTLIGRHASPVRTLIELGCGTARHALQLVKSGLAVTGIDRSTEMVAAGQRSASKLPQKLRDKLRLEQGDVTTFRTSKLHDAAIAMFHVVNYQTSNRALTGMFRTARRALRKGGVFVFDFWHGPGVLTELPAVRIKRAATRHVRVTRIAEPVVHFSRNVVDVKYTLLVEHVRTKQLKRFNETHSMRYLFVPEIELLAASTSFELIEAGEWLTQRVLDDNAWLGYVVLRAT